MAYDPDQYQMEKLTGIRAPSGALNLSRLTGKHLRIVLLHVNGVKGYDIAKQMNMSPARISNILCDPLVQAEIRKRHEELDGEIFSKSVQVVANSLDDEDHSLRLRAADMVWKARGKYQEHASGGASAEDIVQRMLALAAEGHSASVTISATPGGTSGESQQDGRQSTTADSNPQTTIEGDPIDDL